MNDQTEVLCLRCSTTFKETRKTETQKRINPRHIEYCPVCNDMTNHMRLKKLDELLKRLGLSEKPQKNPQYVKKRGV